MGLEAKDVPWHASCSSNRHEEAPRVIHIAFVMLALLPLTTKSTEAPQPGLVKRVASSFLSDKNSGKRGLHLGPFFPRVENVSSGSGPGAVLHFWTPDIGGTRLDIHAAASYSIYGYQHYNAEVGLIPYIEDRLPRDERGTNVLFPLSDLENSAGMPGFNIYASAQHRDYPREDFYGSGPSSHPSERTDYRLKDGLYEGVIGFSRSSLTVTGRVGLLHSSILPGRDDAFPNTALTPSLDFIRLSAGAWLERRDEPQNPHRGYSIGIAASRFSQRSGRDYQWNRMSIDAREYLALGSNRHVIALRQVTSLDKPDAGSLVPFHLQSTLGGSHLLRGFASSRFRDDKLLALSAEYRFEIQPKVEIALIYETGKVFQSMSSFNFREMERSFGAGIRLKSPRKVRLRLDVLRSVEGTRVHLKFSPAF